MPNDAALTVTDLVVRFGGVTALDGVSCTVRTGEVCGLIGPNGAGKTTLFDCVSRLTRPRSGRIEVAGRDLLALPAHRVARLGVSRTFQHLGLVPSLSVRDNVMLGAQHGSRTGFPAAALRVGVRSQERELRRRADAVLDRLGLAPLAGHPAAGLPYGTLKRVELARALAAEPALLMLDEPASGLSHGEVDELAELIEDVRAGMTVLLVEHHMGMVMRLSDTVVVLDFGKVVATGPPAAVQEDPAVLAAYLGTPA
ncbi:MAG TPA: ABC transporter ATP-binding protein [Mycobacteriales bacterium]|jgi:branched-chain amino acid transport system ATP-binding protein|nr:ABC transporter ATP-binding protein [Mycobacteriales bacterium]